MSARRNPVTTRSIHGNVSAKTTKIAAARGMNERMLSWMDVTVCRMLTRMPDDETGEQHRQRHDRGGLDRLPHDAEDEGFRHSTLQTESSWKLETRSRK